MQSTSATYKSLFASVHRVEWKVTINGTEYGQAYIVKKIGGSDCAPQVVHQMFPEDSPSIGNCVAGTFTVTMLLASSAIPRMAEVKPYFRLTNGTTNSEWLPAGVYYIDTRKADEETDTVALVCYDAILKLDGLGGKSYNEIVDRDEEEWPKSMSFVADEIADIIGVDIDSRTVIGSGDAYTVNYPNDYTMREVMGYIAAANGGNWSMTPEGKIRLVRLTGDNTTTVALAHNFGSLKVSPAFASWSKVTVYWADEDAYESGSDTGRSIEADDPWATQGTADGILSILSGTTYQPFYAGNAVIDPAVELGDKVSFTNGNSTVYAHLWSLDMTCSSMAVADIAAPGEDEIDHEYPYASYIDRSLKRKVGLNTAYYGVTISRQKGLEIKRTDGASEALFNSDVFQMSALINGVMTPRIYFDPVKGDYVFDGALGADAVFTDSLYAEQGDIAELTVDRLSTSRRVRLYNLQNTGDDNYLQIQDNYLRLITGTVIMSGATPLTEQATNRYGNPLYWSEIPYSINAQGYPLDEDGNQIYATTDQPVPGEGETLDDYKVMVYQYSELVKAELAFFNESGTYVPMMVMGAGDNNGRTKGILHKAADGFDISFTDSQGENQGLKMNSAGWMDLYGLRKPTELDFSGWQSGYFSEELDGQQTASWLVDFDSQGRPILITDGDGHETAVVW